MDKDNDFGKKLRSIRKSKGLTQEKLAELAGVHEKHISKLEIGYYRPSFNTLNKILKALGITPEDFSFSAENTSVNDNPYYLKSMQILNNANEQEIAFYYGILKQAKIGIEILKI